MASLYLFQNLTLFGLTLLICSVYSSKYVPVLMWSNVKSNNPTPALNHILKEDFSDIVSEKLQNKENIVLIFAEESLSSEDLTSYDAEGHSVFSRISEIRKKWQSNYYPYVESPIDVLKKLSKDFDEILPSQIKSLKVKAGQVIMVDLNDAQENEDRENMLIRHNNIIYNVYKELSSEYKNIIAVYTGRHSSWLDANEPDTEEHNRQRRHLLATDTTTEASSAKPTPLLINSSQILFYTSNTPTITINDNVEELQECPSSSEDATERDIELCTKDNTKTLKFIFNGTLSGYWKLKSIISNFENASERNNVYAPFGFSYHCDETTFDFRNGTIIKLPGWQVQLFEGDVNATQFSSAYDCVGFTTTPIWSGIFVTFILALIMTFGLCMIMDIKTMDRFDDPKGKTISINVSE